MQRTFYFWGIKNYIKFSNKLIYFEKTENFGYKQVRKFVILLFWYAQKYGRPVKNIISR